MLYGVGAWVKANIFILDIRLEEKQNVLIIRTLFIYKQIYWNILQLYWKFEL